MCKCCNSFMQLKYDTLIKKCLYKIKISDKFDLITLLVNLT